MTKEWKTYIRLLGYLKPYRARLFAGILCGIIFAGSSVGWLSAANKTFGSIFNYETASQGKIWLLALALPVIALVRGIGQYMSTYLIQWVGNRVITDLRIQAFSHLQNLSVAFYDSNKTGEMISRTINDTALLERSISFAVEDIVKQPFLLLGVTIYLFVLDWKLAFASLVLFPICMIPVLLYGRKVRKAGKEGQERLADLVSIMQESIAGVRIVKSFCNEQHELNRFTEQCKNFFGRIMKVVRASASVQPIIAFISSVGVACALLYARIVHMPWQDFVTFGAGLVMLYDPIKSLSKLHMVIQHSSGAADRIFEILDMKPTVIEMPDAKDCEEVIESIVFEHVSFSYGNGLVLDDINLSVKRGEKIAIVGPSGSGKTTLLNLLPRFFDVTSGRILINGHDIRELKLKSLRRRIGLVTQETILFNDTVAYNISYGNPDATPEEIERCARYTHAHEFIIKLEHGYNTIVGPQGKMLSGGERQRIAIARAILTNPSVLILDEATSALDSQAEKLVQKALEEVMTGRTVFAVAHRLSTVANFDRIIVMDHGRIVEEGIPSVLLEQNGLYRKLYDIQFGL